MSSFAAQGLAPFLGFTPAGTGTRVPLGPVMLRSGAFLLLWAGGPLHFRGS